jgi:SAM-dependent methyltransferase
MGVMFFADPVAAFANIRRQVKPGGRFVFACWDRPEANPLHPEVLLSHGVANGAASGNSAFSLADIAATAGLLTTAGWAGVQAERLSLEASVPRSVVLDPYIVERVSSNGGPTALEGLESKVDGYARNGEVRVPLAVVIYRTVAPALGAGRSL